MDLASLIAIVLGIGAAIAGAFLAIPTIIIGFLHAVGFGAAGIVAGSFAAWIQGAAIAAGSIFAFLQSLGATAATIGILGAIKAFVGVIIGYIGVLLIKLGLQ